MKIQPKGKIPLISEINTGLEKQLPFGITEGILDVRQGY